MLERPLTKKDLFDLAISIAESTDLPEYSLELLFEKAYYSKYFSNIIQIEKISEKDIVDPETFHYRLIDAKKGGKNTRSTFKVLAEQILNVIFYDELDQMPLYINDPSMGIIARWRLKKGI